MMSHRLLPIDEHEMNQNFSCRKRDYECLAKNVIFWEKSRSNFMEST